MKTIFLKPIFSILLFGCAFLNGVAQKLPNVQQKSLRAPANVKIDAVLNEWSNNLQAHNNHTDVFYTMANDDKNLYLVIKSVDQTNNNKIMAGGINLTVNTAGKQMEKGAYTIVFPFIDITTYRSQMRMVTMPSPIAGGDDIRMGVGPGASAPGPVDPAALAEMRKEIKSTVKEIKMLGFSADIADTIISIYNELNIKTALDYDDKGNLVYEMAIPLKYFHLSTAKAGEFAYNIKLNGLSAMRRPGPNMDGPPRGGGGEMHPDAGPPSGGPMQAMVSPTDFWGKYTLAKP